MAYIQIGDKDFSMYCNELKVNREVNYNAQTNAAGNTVVDYINSKRTIEVGIIPIDQYIMTDLQNIINAFNVSLSFKNPQTMLFETINCIIPENNVEYYTIRDGDVRYKAFTLTFIEL